MNKSAENDIYWIKETVARESLQMLLRTNSSDGIENLASWAWKLADDFEEEAAKRRPEWITRDEE